MRRCLSENSLRYLISSGEMTTENYSVSSKKFLSILKRAIEAEIDLVQIREKNLPSKLLLQLVLRSADKTKDTRTKILVNERFDIALAGEIDGVHLTSTSIPVATVRASVPDSFLIGVSTHSLESATNARDTGADFVTFGPVFETASKIQYGPPQGLEMLKTVCSELEEFPVIALGGIDGKNYESALVAGAKGFAAIGFFSNADSFGKLQ